jgi:hypothetical protein
MEAVVTTVLPQQNGRLLEIRGEKLADDADVLDPAGVLKWQGAAQLYCQEKTVTSTASGRLDLFRKTVIVIPAELTSTLDIQQGDYLRYSYKGTEWTRRVVDVATATMNGVLATTRITIADE